MSSKLVVCDAGPLIILARTEKLFLLTDLFDEIFLTETVQEECTQNLSLPGASVIAQTIHEKILHVSNPHADLSFKETLLSLDEGEKSSILLARQLQATLLIDEKRGRSVAQHLDVRILGTAGLLLRAYQKGLIPDIHTCLEEMTHAGYRLSDRLIEAVLKRAALLTSEKKLIQNSQK
jgi:predicted nucleic acid-binding protein